jgi:hypothetical protein
VDGIISPDSGALAPFSPLRKRAEMDALFFCGREPFFFSGRELLGDDNFTRAFGAFARTFFGFKILDVRKRLAFAGFFSAGRPRPRFFECFAKTLCL